LTGEQDQKDQYGNTSIRKKHEKARLNIAIKKEVAERAKALGINISASFEEYLKILSSKPEPNDVDVVRAYESFFRKIQATYLSNFFIKTFMVEIGVFKDPDPRFNDRKMYLTYDGVGIKSEDQFYIPRFRSGRNLEPHEVKYFYPPERILLNLISEVKKRVAADQIEIQKLNLATKIVSVLFNNTSKNNNDKDKGGGKEEIGEAQASESGSATPHLRRLVESIGQAVEESAQEVVPA
jgi:post-segregation antitoxin CcdA